MVMVESYIAQDFYMPHGKKFIKTDVKPLTCHICKKELNGISITAKVLNGELVFLCVNHYDSKPYQVVSVN
jgi:hypothetical protein